MLGSNINISCPNTILNTIVAEELDQISDELECYKKEEITEQLIQIIRRILKEHKRIIFSGNGYSEEWKEEAKKRGLLELKTTADALPHYTDPKNLALFNKHKVYQPRELHARENILLATYSKNVQIEAKTMIYMLQKQILPAIYKYEEKLAQSLQTKHAIHLSTNMEEKTLAHIHSPLENIDELLENLKKISKEELDPREASDVVLPCMEKIRFYTDEIEQWVPKEEWPLPDYNDLLFQSF